MKTAPDAAPAPPSASRMDATTWEGLVTLAFASDWDPLRAIDWSGVPEASAVAPGWIAILQLFYEGEWQGLEIIQRLMNGAAHRFRNPEMVTYYSTQCYDESKHLFVFRRYLSALGAPPAARGTFDALVLLATRGPLAIERWILGTYFTESLAASVFRRSLELELDPTAKQMIRLMLKDEARHVAGTRLALEAVMAHAGTIDLWLLQQWWRVFVALAARQVRRLGGFGEQIGLDAEDMLRRTFTMMSTMERFVRRFPLPPAA